MIISLQYILLYILLSFTLITSTYYTCLSSRGCDVLTDILQTGIDEGVYPGAIALVGNDKDILYQMPIGHYSYNQTDTKVTVDSMFDIASLSKVVATTSAVALLYQEGYIDLDTHVSAILGDEFSSHGKGDITIKHCLLHTAGFAPDPVPWYWDEEFGCPNTDDTLPAENFSCMTPRIAMSLYNESLQNTPGEVYTYSDLSFITLQMVVGNIVWKHGLVTENDLRQECVNWLGAAAQLENNPVLTVCAFEGYVAREVFHRFSNWMPRTTYLPPRTLWKDCLPTLNDTGEGSYTHRRLQGQVADGDCYAMGGIAGHAGVFSSGPDIGRLLRYLLAVSVSGGIDKDGEQGFLNATTVKLFTTVQNATHSSRALGWSTNTPQSPDYGYDNSCGLMSEETFMHTGYTGTCCCVDPNPKRSLWTVILTNRIYNCQGQLCPSGSSDAVKAIYKEFNSKASQLFYP